LYVGQKKNFGAFFLSFWAISGRAFYGGIIYLAALDLRPATLNLRPAHKIKSFPPTKRVLGAQAGCGDATSLHKNLVENKKLTFSGRRFKRPFFYG
jgi:hypothetical protein